MAINGSDGDFFGQLDFGGEQGGGKPGELLGGVGTGETDLGFYLCFL